MQRRLEWAKELFNEALIVSNELQDHWIMLRSLAGLAGTSSLLADCERAARLFGAVAAVREANGTPEMPVWRDMYDRDLAAVQETLGESWFAAVWAEGRAMSLEQAIAYALEEPASTR
jgi:hypothetical protein